MDPMKDPLIRTWAEASEGDADYLDFLSQSVGISAWIAMSRVFLPRFVEVDGCVLWDRAYDPDNFRRWYNELKGDVAAIESTLNQFRLEFYIDFASNPEARTNAVDLAHAIAAAWRFSLDREFPQKDFDVRATDTEDGPIVSFTSLPTGS
jgi:hypothetical protein